MKTPEEELVEKLKALGIDVNGEATWVETRPIDASSLPSVQKQREMMVQLRDVLKTQLADDTAKLERAVLDLEKIKHGGGV